MIGMIPKGTVSKKALERQMRNWELERAQRPKRPKIRRPEVEDFICLSRQVGVDGRGVARRLAEKLGWPFFDKEILDLMAGDDFYLKQIYSSMDERDLGWTEEVLRSAFEGRFVKNDYFHRLSETVLGLVRQGSCVLLGRGVDLLLPRHLGFRARLTAPLAARREHLAESLEISPIAAGEEIERIEGDRRRFFERHFRLDPEDPGRYDMVLNAERFEIEAAVEVLLAARLARQGRPAAVLA